MSPSLEPIVFECEATELQSIPVTIGGVKYVLKEPDADATAKYESAKHGSVRMNEETGKPERLEGLGDIKPLLVSWCLFEMTEQGPKRVHEMVIRKWKSDIVNRLYDAARDMGGLVDRLSLEDMIKERDKLNREIERQQAAKDEPKNSLSSTADTLE